MFLIRSAFWLSLVVLLIPAEDKPESSNPQPVQVSAVSAYGAAQSAIADFAKFCERQPDTCKTGGAAMETFGYKARHGARMLYEFLDGQLNEKATPAADTLKPADKAPKWRAAENEKPA